MGSEMCIRDRLYLQLEGAVATILYSGVVTFVIVKILDATMGLRVSPEEESDGLDIALHNERGFSL